MRNEILIDELNTLRTELERKRREAEENGQDGFGGYDPVDPVLDILIDAYVFGTFDANDSLETTIEPDEEDMYATIFRDTADKDFKQRVEEYARTGSVADIMRVAETEVTRDYNEGAVQTAIKSGKDAMKRWETMKDDRVRDTHDYLQGVRVPVEARFYTYDGDNAELPGGFELAENNCNCRCWVVIEPT
jgi:hypothetical protein